MLLIDILVLFTTYHFHIVTLKTALPPPIYGTRIQVLDLF